MDRKTTPRKKKKSQAPAGKKKATRTYKGNEVNPEPGEGGTIVSRGKGEPPQVDGHRLKT